MSLAICPGCSNEIPADAPTGLCPPCLCDPPPPSEPPSDSRCLDPHEVFGEYELVEEIGRGGMAEVWEARHVRTRETVALKRVAAGATEEEALRLRVEAGAMQELKKLNHPHIVPILEFGEHEGRLYFTMPLMRGGSLADHLDRLRGDPRRAAKLMAKIAAAVHSAHDRRILHRDLKPANILLDRAGEPHVADFGIAKRMDRDEKLTRTGEVVGTLRYMAPEAYGRSTALTQSADIYSLGVILYELTTPPTPARALDARVDPDFASIYLTCLQKEPEHRYWSAEELAQDLRKYLSGERPGRAKRVWRWVRCHHLASGLLLAVMSFLVIMTWRTISLAREQEALKRAQIIEANRLSAGMIAGTVVSHFRDLSDAVRRVAEDDRLSRALAEGNTNELQAICRAAYERYEDPAAGLKVGNSSPFHRWFVLDRKGISKAYERNLPVGQSFDHRGYFKGAQALARDGSRETYISNAFKGTTDGAYEFAISTPIYRIDGNREWIGVLAVVVATQAKLGSLVLDDDRNIAVLAAPWDPNRELGKINPAPPDPPEYLILRHEAYSTIGEAIALDNHKVRMLGKNSQETDLHILHPLRLPAKWWVDSSDDYEDPLGEGNFDVNKGSLMPANTNYAGRWLAGFAAVGHTGFVVIVQTREDEVLGSELKLAGQLAKWAGVASALSVLLVVFAARYGRIRWPNRRP